MSGWTLSRQAERDLIELTAYGIEVFGERVADAYVESLRACFARLTLHPLIGRPAEAVGGGIRRVEHRRHVVFYEIEAAGVRIVAIIHERSLRSIDL